MLRKMLLGLLFAASFSVQAFTKQECEVIAVNIFYAQEMLNTDPVVFKAVTDTLDANPPEAMKWTEKVKKTIIGLARQLKPGTDPQEIGETVYKACTTRKQV